MFIYICPLMTVALNLVQPPGHRPDLACNTSSSSLQDFPQVWKFGSRGEASPCCQISGLIQNPRPCVLDQRPNPTAQGWTQVVPGPNPAVGSQEGTTPGPQGPVLVLGSRRGQYQTLGDQSQYVGVGRHGARLPGPNLGVLRCCHPSGA